MTGLHELIKNGESETVEFKKSISEIKEAVIDICGFSNSKGGFLIFGISNKGKIIGQESSDSTLRKISNTIVDNTDPKIYPSIEKVTIKDEEVVLITIDSSPYKPHTAYGKPYKRVGTTTKQMSQTEYHYLLNKRDAFHYDRQILENAKLKDIDTKKLKWFLRTAKYERNLDVSLSLSAQDALSRLELRQDGELTNAAVLLFGREPQNKLIQSEVRCGRFKGNYMSEGFIDMKVLRGSIIDQVDDAEKFVLNNIKRAAWTVPGQVARVEKWEYPPDAVREAITNAIVHRDYQSTANVQIRIFDDRMEVWNPGRLPEGMTVEMLKKKHESKPFNPLIARMFFLIKYIEQWGMGTNNIVKWCRENGNPDPKFEYTGTSLVVTFRKAKIAGKEQKEKIIIDLNERQKKALEYIKEKGHITNREYRNINNVGRVSSLKELSEMVKKGVLKPFAKGRSLRYLVSD